VCAQAAKKRGKGKKRAAAVDPLKCGVCEAVTEVVLSEVRKKENDTTTLDLRWGLTAEVKEGKARRLGKVIPYKRSELLAVEVESLKIPKILRLWPAGGSGRAREGDAVHARPSAARRRVHAWIHLVYSPLLARYSPLLESARWWPFSLLPCTHSTPLNAPLLVGATLCLLAATPVYSPLLGFVSLRTAEVV
jgi:hypothetical protein